MQTGTQLQSSNGELHKLVTGFTTEDQYKKQHFLSLSKIYNQYLRLSSGI